MNRADMKKSVNRALLLTGALVAGSLIYNPAAGQSATPARRPVAAVATRTVAAKPATAVAADSAAEQKKIVDRYCVTCHNDRVKSAGLTLQNLNLAQAGAHGEVWERVIRKLRAGMMPPPGMSRPPLPQYEGLRDWLENQMDQAAAAHPNPGSVILHRLNRTEYANAIRDLLDLELDVSTLLPSDDAARGFDNVAGSLTISPTLLEAYMGAATRIARTAVGFWKSPTEAAYISPGDT